MAKKIKRTKTRYKSIYYNENTRKYDVKYNYKVYNPLTQKNDYKSKWVYGLPTLTQARSELAKLQTGRIKSGSQELTLEGAFELWKIKADAQNFSPVTVRNTRRLMNMIYRFLPAETKLKNITEDVYHQFCADIRNHGYTEETISSINATLRKLINLACKKKLLNENILDFADNMRIRRKDNYRVITKEEFDRIDAYFRDHVFWRLGVNNYPKYRLLFNILYYCGLRIGEAIALTFDDFEEYVYDRRVDLRISVAKSYVSDIRLTKPPKNFKNRTVPLSPAPCRMYLLLKEEHLAAGGSPNDRIFPWGYGSCNSMLDKACQSLNLPSYNCHEFRHTFISNLIRKNVPLPVIEKVSGDTQTTILKRYSHMFENDEVMVLAAMENL